MQGSNKQLRDRGRRSRQGTASVEVIVMLPFFMIVFAGIFYMHSHYMGRQQAMLRARSCTWTYASGGCRDPSTLRECLKDRKGNLGEATTLRGDGSEADAPAEAGSGNQRPPESSNVTIQATGDAKVDSDLGGRLEKMRDIPLLGAAIEWLFGVPVQGTALEPIYLTRVYDNKFDNAVEAVVKGKYFMMCNTVPQSWSTTAKTIFCGFVGNLKLFGCPP